MNDTRHNILVLALGNDILGDDAVAWEAVRLLKEEFGSVADFVELACNGLELLDIMEGYQKVLLLDSVVSCQELPGTVLEIALSDVEKDSRSSPHFVGLRETIGVARALGIRMPDDLRIVAMEIDAPQQFGSGLSASVWQSLPALVRRARIILTSWGVAPLSAACTPIASSSLVSR